jgi:hypothetical protein
MQQPAKINYRIYQGATFQEIYRWETQTKVYVPIQAISKSAPCVITTQSNHGIPAGWRVRVVGAGAMKEINTVSEDDYYLATTTTSNQITLNQVNSLNFTTYTSGGVVEYNDWVALTNYKARMQIRPELTSQELIYEATSEAGQIVIDDLVYKTITLTIPAQDTQGFDFDFAVYSLELYKDSGPSSGEVITFLQGNLTLVREVTR